MTAPWRILLPKGTRYKPEPSKTPDEVNFGFRIGETISYGFTEVDPLHTTLVTGVVSLRP